VPADLSHVFLMRFQIICDTPHRRIGLAWLSLQPDGSISFGLNDRSFVSPRFKERISVWNAYNRVGIAYLLESQPEALTPVQNPHFTFHPPMLFHLKDDGAAANSLFRGIANVGLALDQDGEMPWLRAVTSQLALLSGGGIRPDNVATNEIGIASIDEKCSMYVEVDFVNIGDFRLTNYSNHCFIPWGDVAIRVSIHLSVPRAATLSWFHFY
jgi:hypothetical protein